MRIDVITLFPGMFGVVRDLGVTGRPMLRVCGRSRPGTPGISPPTCIARWTTVPMAAGLGW